MATEELYFVLRVNNPAIAVAVESKPGLGDDGIKNAFDVLGEVNEQPLRLNRRLTSRPDDVKCVDLHPKEPWMLCALYNGHVHVMNY